MTQPPVSKHSSFEIVFLPHFSDNAARLLALLQDVSFLERLSTDADEARAELSDLGIEIRGKDDKLVDHGRDLTELADEMKKFRVTPKNPRPALGWCKISAIAAAATEAAP